MIYVIEPNVADGSNVVPSKSYYLIVFFFKESKSVPSLKAYLFSRKNNIELKPAKLSYHLMALSRNLGFLCRFRSEKCFLLLEEENIKNVSNVDILPVLFCTFCLPQLNKSV